MALIKATELVEYAAYIFSSDVWLAARRLGDRTSQLKKKQWRRDDFNEKFQNVDETKQVHKCFRVLFYVAKSAISDVNQRCTDCSFPFTLRPRVCKAPLDNTSAPLETAGIDNLQSDPYRLWIKEERQLKTIRYNTKRRLALEFSSMVELLCLIQDQRKKSKWKGCAF